MLLECEVPSGVAYGATGRRSMGWYLVGLLCFQLVEDFLGLNFRSTHFGKLQKSRGRKMSGRGWAQGTPLTSRDEDASGGCW